MNKKLYKLMNWPQIEGIVYGDESDPFKILGPHMHGTSCLFQTFAPGAKEVSIILKNEKIKMELVDDAGFFAQTITGKIPSEYKYEYVYPDEIIEAKDTYSFSGYETDDKNVSKITAGIHYELYDILGAHKCSVKGVDGIKFAVWAPNAVSVFVVGDFNRWNQYTHPMKKNETAGIFELFIPDIKEGTEYKYYIKSKMGAGVLKSDPFSTVVNKENGNASVVYFSDYKFDDDAYIKSRKKLNKTKMPLSVYEVYAGNIFKADDKCSAFEHITDKLVKHISETGYTHIQLMPVMEHELEASWGYQTTHFYATAAKYGKPDDLKKFIDVMHKNNIGVILDWAPFHFPKNEYGLSNFDGTCLYEHLDSRKNTHPFYGTALFNYGRPEVSNYLIANALYWIKEFHVDGIKMDSVASMLYLDYGKNDGEWVANIYGGNENLEAIEFIKHLNSIINKNYKDVLLIANEDSGYPKTTLAVDEDGLGFDYKYNTGMTKDYFDYISYDPYFRAHHHSELTFSMVYQYSENYINALSHENFVYGCGAAVNRMPGESKDKLANLRLTYAYMFMHPGAKMLFQGQDFATASEFDESVEEQWQLLRKNDNKGIKNLVRDLNKLYKKYPALYKFDNESLGFNWINSIDAEKCIISFMRKTDKDDEAILVVCNFAGVDYDLRVGTDIAGKYKEILNTDAKEYGGKNKTNSKNKFVSEIEADSMPYSIEIKVPALTACAFLYVPFTEAEKKVIEKKKEAELAKTRASEYHEIAVNAETQVNELKKVLEETKAKIKEMQLKADEAYKNEECEILKAKKALEEAMNQ
ncbi:MAG: 1,4-alpha-glucan branching protein GlgB [Lachnospiraceae bacterium]|nr:1,4-alpha-glucan branching protein GlgB [Lachnospiraceae bacterium]